MAAEPWIKHYDEGVPPSLQPYPLHTIVDIVRKRARKIPQCPALFFKGASMTWGELERISNAFALALQAAGLKKGGRVALLVPNSPQMIISELAIWKTGAVAVPMNPLYTEHELVYALNECGAEIAIVLTPFYEKVRSAIPSTSLRKVVASNIKEYLSPLKKILFTLFKEKKDGHAVTLHEDDLLFCDMIKTHLGLPEPDISTLPTDPALFLFTGGTTGMPKCAVCTHHALIISGMQIARWFSVVLDRGNDIVMINMPLFHVYAQVGILGAALVDEYPFVLIPNPRDLDDLVATIKKYRPSVLPGVPTLFNALADHPGVKKDRKALSSLKLCVSGAAPLLLETKKRFEELTGGRIIDAYALTESMIGAVLTPVLGTYKEGSVGIPAPDVKIKIVDQDDGKCELPPKEVGEVIMRAPQLMKEYWQRPGETMETVRDGWLYTGDLGYLDNDGYLFIIDRKKDLIKPGGFQVWPRDVEEVIAAHPDVREVGVAGVPDSYQGEAVKAWVVLREGARLDAEDLREFCRKELAAYKIPKFFSFTRSLPKSLVGKVLRRELVEEHCREVS
ncbi:AMP-dependent synthetase [Prosthecochloris marina]|uniref:AMP-dependent synthetase n=2 Tax=Prosthecochloris TaxID=1101 RepID=A0A317TBL1_9CHLB|nr:AMP-binding protein [Prosthecochloris marina]PWW83136.1 AMP-dependent synthetase [Prosthecochloris marina]